MTERGMGMIRLITMKDGKVVMDRRGSETASLEDVVYVAECEVDGGYADYARVEVDGKIYIEYES